MHGAQAVHMARVRHLRESFAAANERLVARLRGATDLAAERHVTNGWSAAQIGWHVATVSTRFAAMIAGDLAGPQPLPDSFCERTLGGDCRGDSRSPSGSSAVHPPPACTPTRRRRRARGVGHEDGARVRRAHLRARGPHGDHQRDRRHDQRLPAGRVGYRAYRATQQTGEAGAGRGVIGVRLLSDIAVMLDAQSRRRNKRSWGQESNSRGTFVVQFTSVSPLQCIDRVNFRGARLQVAQPPAATTRFHRRKRTAHGIQRRHDHEPQRVIPARPTPYQSG